MINKNYPLTIDSSVDIVLIGSGIMSSTLGIFLSILEPHWNIHIYERLSKIAQESSNAWNNAGTGHAAFCELNYTTYNYKTNITNIQQALTINSEFEMSLQFWSYLVRNHILYNPQNFINNIPHMSFVWGEDNIRFLKHRFQALSNHILFRDMVYSEDPYEISSWTPLIMKGRNKNQKIAATYIKTGTDVNFGEIAQQCLNKLQDYSNVKIYLNHHVTHIKNCSNGNWKIHFINTQNNKKDIIFSNHVFIGAGGQSLNILQTSGIPEIKGYAGFPVGGQFLITKNPKIVQQHSAKVYGKICKNMPPMSVPHIDTRIINDKKFLLFGPFATFSSKFLKYGSWLDLFYSLNKNNLMPIIQSGIDNFSLIKYLINQLTMSHKSRINILKEYYPQVNPKDWSLIQAGQRVQIIKKNQNNRGMLQFGTEIISSKNGTLSALLGASPGASTSVAISIKILNIMFQKKINSDLWKNKIIEIVPSSAKQFNKNFILTDQIKQNTRNILKLNYIK